jgi:hypothetical protein
MTQKTLYEIHAYRHGTDRISILSPVSYYRIEEKLTQEERTYKPEREIVIVHSVGKKDGKHHLANIRQKISARDPQLYHGKRPEIHKSPETKTQTEIWKNKRLKFFLQKIHKTVISVCREKHAGTHKEQRHMKSAYPKADHHGRLIYMSENNE